MKKQTKKKNGLKKWHLFGTCMAAIVLFAIFGDKGFIDAYRLGVERDGIVAVNHSIDEENKDLTKRIELLKTDKRFIEFIAKKELGMIGRDEVLYRISGQE
ncbi:MAG: septum formation initiator family protein [Proteobacteria bacterium]|nr:septum formation initiator family protein [Pseudomonadota bacterium]